MLKSISCFLSKQECSTVGCIPPALVDTTRCQHWGWVPTPCIYPPVPLSHIHPLRQNSWYKVQHVSPVRLLKYLLMSISVKTELFCVSFQSRPNCLFPELIERLALLRAVINPKKPPPPTLLTAIRDHLHLVSTTHSCLRSPPPGKLLLAAIPDHLHLVNCYSQLSEITSTW